MTWTTVLQEVQQLRFEELYERRQRRELTVIEAAEILVVTERTFRHWKSGDPFPCPPFNHASPSFQERGLNRITHATSSCRTSG